VAWRQSTPQPLWPGSLAGTHLGGEAPVACCIGVGDPASPTRSQPTGDCRSAPDCVADGCACRCMSSKDSTDAVQGVCAMRVLHATQVLRKHG
jgi:hypothetical protein